MNVEKSLRALLGLIADLQNGHSNLKGYLQNEQFYFLLKQIQRIRTLALQGIEGNRIPIVNQEETNQGFSEAIKDIEERLDNLEGSLFSIIESLNMMFQKVAPAFSLGDEDSLNGQINALTLQAEQHIFVNEEHIEALEANFSNFLSFVNANILSIKNQILNAWRMYADNKKIFHQVFIEEITQSLGTDKKKRGAFMEQLSLLNQETLDYISQQIRNFDQDLLSKKKLIDF